MSCSDSTAPEGAVDRKLLEGRLVLRAVAQGKDAELDIACGITTIIVTTSQSQVTNGRVVQRASGGGDATRSIRHPDGSGVSFWAHTAFPSLELHLIREDSIEIRSPESEKVTDSRFWKELSVFPGTQRVSASSPGILAAGSWTCRPMDTPPSSGGYHDPRGTVRGTWTLEREVIAGS